jgi:prepilin-type processing-associated H-X9-DG protein
MKQLQLALTSYDTTQKKLPGYANELFNPNSQKSSPASGFPLMPEEGRRASWIVMMFPYIENNALWDEWSNRFAGNPSVPAIEMLTCPSDPPEIPTEPWCSYVGNAGQAFSDSTRSDKRTENPADGIFFDDCKNPHLIPPAAVDDRENPKGFPRGQMSLGYVQANDGTSRTFMVSENLHAWYYSYGLANDVSTIKDTKHLFGFVWKNRPDPTERINGDRYFDHSPPPQNMEAFAVVGTSTSPPNPYESYGYPSSNHPGGVNVAFCGGQVTFVAETIDPLVYGQLCTPNRNRSSLADFSVSGTPTPERRMPAPADNAY